MKKLFLLFGLAGAMLFSCGERGDQTTGTEHGAQRTVDPGTPIGEDTVVQDGFGQRGTREDGGVEQRHGYGETGATGPGRDETERERIPEEAREDDIPRDRTGAAGERRRDTGTDNGAVDYDTDASGRRQSRGVGR
ncbi:MAG: hypothetical protein ACK4ND_11745 [Cytophagaceae bacterium]